MSSTRRPPERWPARADARVGQGLVDKRKNIQPQPTKKKIPYRFNWLSPFVISKFHPSVLYMGSNYVLKSYDRGDTWFEISQDLSCKKDILGNVPYATITSIDESPLTPEILYAGTDDGNVWVTKNGGKYWEKISHILAHFRFIINN